MSSKQRVGKSFSEAGKMGAEKTREITKQKLLEKIIEYEKHPNKCQNCNLYLSYKKRNNKFCSRKCSAIKVSSLRERNSYKDIRTKLIKCSKCGEETRVNVRSGTIVCEKCRSKNNPISKIIICEECGKDFWGKPYQKRCRECSPDSFCEFCGKPIKFSKRFCDNKCQGGKRVQEIIKNWEAGDYTGMIGKYGEQTSSTIKEFLKKECNGECSICGISEWMGKPVPLVLDHIDGNSNNNKKENLRIVCRNCDGQLDTFCSKNKGRGRFYRRERYKEGKSS